MERFTYSPEHPERPALNQEQTEALQGICERYNVTFNPDDYRVNPPDSTMMPGWAEGWVGGYDESRPTIYVGVSPDGRIHS